MDQNPSAPSPDSLSPSSEICLVGLGGVCGAPLQPETVDPRPWMKVKKMRKYMGRQDELAIMAAGRALEDAALAEPLGERTGLYLSVGYIPFEKADVDDLFQGSSQAGHFSMQAFSTQGLDAVNPLLAFKCLPNMPAFHITSNFDLQGPYLVSYPGPGQLYGALEAACLALAQGRIDRALVVGVAHQQNFLVEHHFSRLSPATPSENLLDAAACLILERESLIQARGARSKGRLLSLSQAYTPHDPLQPPRLPGVPGRDNPGELVAFKGESVPGQGLVLAEYLESTAGTCLRLDGVAGPASLPLLLAKAPAGVHTHRLWTRDGIQASSLWSLGGVA